MKTALMFIGVTFLIFVVTGAIQHKYNPNISKEHNCTFTKANRR